MALLSSGCRATVDGLTNVQSSSTTQQWQATSLDDNNLHVPCRLSSKHFISGQLKFIPLVRYSVIPYSAFYSVPPPPLRFVLRLRLQKGGGGRICGTLR